MSMLAKVFKDQSAAGFTPFLIEEFGEASPRSKGITEFVVPNFEEFRYEAEAAVGVATAALIHGEAVNDTGSEALVLFARAEQDAAAAMQLASEKAIREARAELESQFEERTAEMRGQFAESLESVSALSVEIAARVEADVVKLALELAKKIVGREVAIDPEIALNVVRLSLGKLHDRAIAEIHLNPDDFAFVQSHRAGLDFRGSLDLVEDASISLGGCLIHTDTGDIDARIESQFDEISHGLFA